MGADYFGFRGCPLQARLGADEFVQGVKLRAHVDALEARRAEIEIDTGERLEDVSVAIEGTAGPAHAFTVRELKIVAGAVGAGIPECKTCPISSGRPLGCHRDVAYPVDAAFERALFDYFVGAVDFPGPPYLIATDVEGRPLTAAGLIHDLVVHELGAEDSPFRLRRGRAPGALAELPAPLEAELSSRGGERVDSARVLEAAFGPIESYSALELYAHFFEGFARYAGERPELGRSRTVAEVLALASLLSECARYGKRAPLDVFVLA